MRAPDQPSTTVQGINSRAGSGTPERESDDEFAEGVHRSEQPVGQMIDLDSSSDVELDLEQ